MENKKSISAPESYIPVSGISQIVISQLEVDRACITQKACLFQRKQN